MSQAILDRPDSATLKARDSTKPPERLEAIYRGQREREWRATADKLDVLRKTFAREFKEIVPKEIRRAARAGYVQDDPREPGRRYRSLAQIRESGVDLARLRGLYDRIHREFDEITRKDVAFTLHETVVGSLADILELPPFIFPDPDKEKMFFAPYSGIWDRIEQSQASGDGVVDENFSYLDGTFARLGARLRAHNHDASDIDLICAYREGGYLVPFRTLKTGILQVKADLSALICKHHVSTYDEWGWSDFHATTRGRLILAVFWNWEDNDPANEVSDQWFVGGLDCSGDGESFPGTTVQATPGERRVVNLYTDMAFPAGQDLWVYVGLSDKIWSILNDVEIDISIDSAWQLNSIGIRSL